MNVAVRLQGQLIPAVPVPFRGTTLAEDALERYAQWMSEQPVGGVAVWAHTGRGTQLTPEQRDRVLAVWRRAMPNKVIVAGANSVEMARAARRGGADALLAFPRPLDAVEYHVSLAQELPVIAFYLYDGAGGVAYDNATLHQLLGARDVIGIKVATLDSVMTFQRVANLMKEYPGKLLITGEDRFLGYSLTMGARSALIGMAAALTDVQAKLLRCFVAGDFGSFVQLSGVCDRFAQSTFVTPIEGYIRRMLWAAAAEGAIPEDACDDPWGPPLDPAEREVVRRAVRDARAAGA